MAWDSTFKNILKQLLGASGISVITETEIPTSNQRIDFIIPDNDQSVETPFKLARKVVIGEFKSENDKLLDGDLLMLISKAFNYIALSHGYGDQKSKLDKIDTQDITCILFLGGSKKASKLSSLNLEMNEINSGIYEINGGFLQILIFEIDNITLSGNFDGLKMFAREKIRLKTMKEAIKNDNNFIKSIAYFLYKEELIALAEAEGETISKISISIRSAVESLGFRRVIEEMGLNRVIEEIGLEEIFKSLSKEQLDRLIEMRKKEKR